MDTNEKLVQSLTEIGKAFEEFKAEHTRQIAELKRGSNDPLAETKIAALQKKIDDEIVKRDELAAQVKAESAARDEMDRKLNALRFEGNKGSNEIEQKALADWNLQIKAIARDRGDPQPEEQTLEAFRGYKAAVNKFLRKGSDALTSEERKAMLVGSDVEGGFFVTPDLGGTITKKVYEVSQIRQIAAVQAIGSDALEGIQDLDTAAGGWVGEVATRADSNTPQVGKYRIEANELYSQPKASQKLLDDANVDIEAWLADKVANYFARTEGAAFINGTGVAQPRGFTTYTTAATGDATRAWGTIEHVGTGQSADFASSSPADVLFTLLYAFKPYYLNNATFVTTREVIGKIRKFKESTTNAYMWQPGLQQGQPDRLIGYPILNCQDMPALAANSLSLALGDFKSAYQIVDRLGVRVIRDNLTDKPNIKFYTIKRVGGAVLNFEAVKFIKFI